MGERANKGAPTSFPCLPCARMLPRPCHVLSSYLYFYEAISADTRPCGYFYFYEVITAAGGLGASAVSPLLLEVIRFPVSHLF